MDNKKYYPPQDNVHERVEGEKNPPIPPLSPEALAALQVLKSQGHDVSLAKDPHPERENTYHYLPYHFDSGLERKYFVKACTMLANKNLEIYFNGDDTLTDFKIDCYKRKGQSWVYIGKYVPDFLMLDRKADGSINRIAIIETKGDGFAAKFADKRNFMDGKFITVNNEKFGYDRFHFLYLEDTFKLDEILRRTLDVINNFFTD